MANNAKKKPNYKNNGKGNNNTSKKEVKKNYIKKEEEVKKIAKEVKTESKAVVNEEEKKEKKSFSLTSKQKDVMLVLLVLVLLVVGFVLTNPKKEKLDIELPVTLTGEAGFTEINYNEYKEKVANNEMFLVVIVKDGCGYCEMYEPIVEEVANEYKLPFYYINLTNMEVEDKEELTNTNKYLKKNKNDWGTPTTLFMYGENVVDSISGYVEKDTFVEFVKENFKVEE